MTTNPEEAIDTFDHESPDTLDTETRVWPVFERWEDREGDNYFIRRLYEGSAYFQIGREYYLPVPDVYMFGASIGYNNADAADLIRRIAEFNGLEVDIRPKTE